MLCFTFYLKYIWKSVMTPSKLVPSMLNFQGKFILHCWCSNFLVLMALYEADFCFNDFKSLLRSFTQDFYEQVAFCSGSVISITIWKK